MLKSMTGFGRAKYETNSREYIIDIKSVNNRYSDITIKMPRSISFLEEKVKQKVTNAISRGKVEVFITFNNYSEQGKNIKINSELAKRYIEEIKQLSEDTQINMNINQYVLIGSTIKSYLSYLYDNGKLIYEFIDNKMMWKRCD